MVEALELLVPRPGVHLLQGAPVAACQQLRLQLFPLQKDVVEIELVNGLALVMQCVITIQAHRTHIAVLEVEDLRFEKRDRFICP